MALTEALHEGLRALQARGGAVGPEGPEPSSLERIDEAERERQLGPDDDEVCLLGRGQLDQARNVVRTDLCIASHRGGAGVARRDDDLVAARGDRRRQRVLARARTDDQDSFALGHPPLPRSRVTR